MENIVTAPKTDSYHFRINPQVRSEVEAVYAKSGISFTQAMKRLMAELDAGRKSGELIEEEEAYRRFGVTPE